MLTAVLALTPPLTLLVEMAVVQAALDQLAPALVEWVVIPVAVEAVVREATVSTPALAATVAMVTSVS